MGIHGHNRQKNHKIVQGTTKTHLVVLIGTPCDLREAGEYTLVTVAYSFASSLPTTPIGFQKKIL